MATYRNTRTGAEFYSNCECQGADIVRLPEAPAAEPAAPAEGKKTTKKPAKK